MSWTITDYRGDIVVYSRTRDPKDLLELAAALQRRYEKETANGRADVPSISATASPAADDGPNYCGDANT